MKQANPSSENGLDWYERLRALLHRWLPVFPWMVFAAAMSLTWAEWELEKRQAHHRLDATFDAKANEIVDKIAQRTQTYEDLLRGVQALFAWHQVEEEEFAAYIKALNISKHFAGIHTINFILRLSDNEKNAHEQAMRRKGHADYQIKPPGTRAFYAPLTYIEPSERADPRLYGLDTLVLPALQQAREQSRESGEARISGKIQLPGQTRHEQTGFALNFPIYYDGINLSDPVNRRNGLYGWVEASFRMDEFIRHLLGESDPELALEIYDGINASPATQLYDSHYGDPNKRSASHLLRKEQRILIAGRNWTVVVHALPAFHSRLELARSGFILQTGISMSLLLLLTTWLLVRGQGRAREAAAKLAEELQARAKVEAGLMASEKRLQEIINMLPIALFIKDTRSRFMLLNHACEAQFGLRAKDLLGNDASQYFPAEQMKEFLAMDRKVFDEGLLVEFDEVVWNASLREDRSVHTYKKPVFDEHGYAQYLICMTVDITERCRTEEWLRLLETCVARLNDVVFITEPVPHNDQWPKILFVNDAFELQTGYPRQEVLGNTSEILRGPQTSNHELRRIGRAIREWQPIRSELICHTKSGKPFWMELELVPIADTGGKLRYWVTVGRNVSERKAAEQALLASEAMHREIIDHAPLPMLVADMETDQIVYANHRCTQMFAASQEELNAYTACHFFAEAKQRRALAAQVRAVGFLNDVEVMLQDAKEQTFWAMLSMVRSRYEGRDAIISSMVDISAIKLIQEQLHEAREKADSANSAKSAFLSNMSHEIRTPMNSILGMTYLALATALDAKQRDYLEKIHLSGQHLLALIDDILDFSKIEAGMFTIESIPFKLHDVTSKLHDLMAQRIAAKGLLFDLQVSPEANACYLGDALRISQILINLTGNAVKFTDQGKITVDIHSIANQGEEYRLKFSVSDSGIGMTAKQLENLFKPFQQADVSSSRKYGGTGLGLAISRQLVELMGGEIGVTSTPQQGSTFWFTLPLLRQAEACSDTVNPASLPVAELMAHARQQLQGAQVLLAEDSGLNQQVAVELLQSVGVQVCVANDGREALHHLEQREFDCVLMDVQMPGMDGLEATRAIRANPRLHNTIIIAMTANASSQDRSQCLTAGMNDFISKPIKPALLYATLAKWIHLPDTDTPPSVNPQTVEPIDLSLLTDLIGDDPALIKKFINMFFDSADSQMEQIEVALMADNQPELARLLHGLRGEACAMGAQEFGALCRQMEKSLGGQQALTLRLFARMQSLLEQVKQQMRAQLHAAEMEMPI